MGGPTYRKQKIRKDERPAEIFASVVDRDREADSPMPLHYLQYL